jgi:peptidoglycan hydrolase CwlO-like protein
MKEREIEEILERIKKLEIEVKKLEDDNDFLWKEIKELKNEIKALRITFQSHLIS